MEQFVNSNIDDLFGPSRVGKVPAHNYITWPQIAVVGGVIVLTVVVAAVIVAKADKRRHEEFMTEIKYQSVPNQPSPNDEEIARQVFLANRIKNSKPKSTSHAV
jgi:hypothetical protein